MPMRGKVRAVPRHLRRSFYDRMPCSARRRALPCFAVNFLRIDCLRTPPLMVRTNCASPHLKRLCGQTRALAASEADVAGGRVVPMAETFRNAREMLKDMRTAGKIR